MKRVFVLFLLFLPVICDCRYPVYAGTSTVVVPCNFRVELDNNNPHIARTDQARLGRDVDGSTDRRVWAEFDISNLTGKTVTDVGFRVYNEWSGVKISDLRYCAIQPSNSSADNLYLQHTFANRYAGFIWNILSNNKWSPSDNADEFFMPDWSLWKRNGSGTTLIQDIQSHIDGKKLWFAVEFDCFQCLSSDTPNLRFPSPDESNPASVIMEIQVSGTDLGDVIKALQILSGLNPAGVSTDTDMNGDGKIGVEDAVCGLQKIAEIR